MTFRYLSGTIAGNRIGLTVNLTVKMLRPVARIDLPSGVRELDGKSSGRNAGSAGICGQVRVARGVTVKGVIRPQS